MKKSIVAGLLCGVMLTTAGCGDKTEDVSVLEKEPVAGAAEPTQSTEVTAQSTETATQETTETVANTDASGEDLYEAFKKGAAKAKYRGTGDRTSYLETSAVLEVGQSYTVEEIAEELKTVEEYKDLVTSVNAEYSMIDCGQDGVQEMLVEATLGDEFMLYMIIKEVDGELVICFDQDVWSRTYVVVNPDGTIESGGSGGAAIHYADYSFVDATGEYKYYYGIEETLTLYDDYYAYKTGEDYVAISAEGLDAEHIGIRDYYFEPDYKQRTNYYTYFMFDDNGMDVTTDADYDDSNELKKRFTEVGIQVYTMADINQMLLDRAKEIGYSK